jgi:hypothetical protein
MRINCQHLGETTFLARSCAKRAKCPFHAKQGARKSARRQAPAAGLNMRKFLFAFALMKCYNIIVITLDGLFALFRRIGAAMGKRFSEG